MKSVDSIKPHLRQNLRGTIITGIKNKKIVIDKETSSIDPEHPTNKKFLEELVRSNRAGKEKHKNKSKQPPILDALLENAKEIKRHNDITENLNRYGNLEDQKTEQEIKLKIEQILQIRQKRLVSLGILITRESVERRIAKFGQGLKTHVLSIPRKITPRIVSMSKSGISVAEIEKYISEELEKAMKNAKAGN